MCILAIFPGELFILSCYGGSEGYDHFLSYFYLPVFIIWLAISIIYVAFSKKEKITQKILWPTIFTVIYAIIYFLLTYFVVYNNSIVGNDYSYAITATAGTSVIVGLGALMSIPFILTVGYLCDKEVEKSRNIKTNQKIVAQKNRLLKILNDYEVSLKLLEEFEVKNKTALSLATLIENASADSDCNIRSTFIQKENERYAEYYQIILANIPEIEKQDFPIEYSLVSDYVIALKNKIKKSKAILYKINTYDSKQLEALEKNLDKGLIYEP